MNAFILEKGVLHISTKELKPLGEMDVLIELNYAGLNRRDLYMKDRIGKTEDKYILGSDGMGTIAEKGNKVINYQVGEEVIINPALNWEKNTPAPPTEFDVLGVPTDGTFSHYIVVSQQQIMKKPSYLSNKEAAVIGLSGLTGFRALFTQGQLKSGQTVFIPGAGSGVATYLIQFAKAVGATVITSSRSKTKREHALKIGADLAIDTYADWKEELKKHSVDLVIESVGEATFNRSLSILKKGGTIVVFGSTTNDLVKLNLRDFFYGQYKLIGSTMGSKEEFIQMLNFCQEHKIHPVIDSEFDLETIHDAFEHLEKNNQFGKIVINLRNKNEAIINEDL